MAKQNRNETMGNRRVTYTLEMEGKFTVVDYVLARVCVETSEQLFAPKTVEPLQKMVWEQ